MSDNAKCPRCGGWMLWTQYASRPVCVRCGYREPARTKREQAREVRHG